MIKQIINKENIQKIAFLFSDIRFFMGRSVLQGKTGKIYVDKFPNPQISFLCIKDYFCFISGIIEKEKLKEIIDTYFKECILILSDNLTSIVEEIYSGEIIKGKRYSLKKDPIFDKEKLNHMVYSLDSSYSLVKIDEKLAKKIKKLKFINITDNYKKNGIGYCCLLDNEIIGVASSNIFYEDGIEVNIKVKENYRRKGIATALAANLILDCLKENKKISWDAANMNSVKLAEKLGFEYDSAYDIYYFEE